MLEKIAIRSASLVIAIVVFLLLARVFNLWNLLPGGTGVIGINIMPGNGNNAQQVNPNQLNQNQYYQGITIDPDNPLMIQLAN